MGTHFNVIEFTKRQHSEQNKKIIVSTERLDKKDWDY